MSVETDKMLAQLRELYDKGLIDKETYEFAVRRHGADPNAIHIGRDAKDNILVAGDNNNVIVNPKNDPEALRLRYLETLAKDTENLPWASLDPEHADPGRESLVLTDIYTAPDTTELEKPETEDQVREHLRHQADAKRISAQDMISRESQLVLLGDPGSGKSTFVNFLAYIMAKAGSDPQSGRWINLLKQNGKWDHGILFPVRVILRDFAAGLDKDTTQGNAELLLSYLRTCFVKPELGNLWETLYDGLLKKDRIYLILLDGLDEVAADKRQMVVNAIDDFAAKYAAHHYLVTCRIYAYIGQDYQLRKFRQATLTPFSEEQITHFISAWYHALFLRGRFTKKEAETRADSLKLAATRPDLLGFSERPLLMTIMAVLDTFRGRLPDDRVELYKGAIDLLLRRWESRVGGEKGLMETLNIPGLKISDLEAGLYDVAFHVHAGHDQASDTADIRESLLRERLAPYLNKNWDKAWIFADYVRERAGLLIRHKPDAYTFPHRTFQEFMAACHLVGMREYPTESARLILQDPDRWREVFVLAAGYASRGQAIPSVNALCPVGISDTENADANAFRRAEIAGEALLEIGLVKVRQDDYGKAVLKRIRNWLAAALQADKILEAKARVAAGNILARLGDPRDLEIFIPVRGGEYELSLGKFSIDPFEMSKYPVTNQWYAKFIEDGGYEKKEFWTDEGLKWLEHTGGKLPRFWHDRKWNCPNAPVVGVCWYEAAAFARWMTMTKNDGNIYRLPDENEWEAAAAGSEKREYAYGNQFDKDRCNAEESGIGKTSSVGVFSAGDTPEGISDLTANVWEWTISDYHKACQSDDFPLDKEIMKLTDEIESGSGDERKKLGNEYVSKLDEKERMIPVLRGGSWGSNARNCRAARRDSNSPGFRYGSNGFRLVFSS